MIYIIAHFVTYKAKFVANKNILSALQSFTETLKIEP